jgi:hypothetical protein
VVAIDVAKTLVAARTRLHFCGEVKTTAAKRVAAFGSLLTKFVQF